jgi:hypothetical protein
MVVSSEQSVSSEVAAVRVKKTRPLKAGSNLTAAGRQVKPGGAVYLVGRISEA